MNVDCFYEMRELIPHVTVYTWFQIGRETDERLIANIVNRKWVDSFQDEHQKRQDKRHVDKFPLSERVQTIKGKFVKRVKLAHNYGNVSGKRHCFTIPPYPNVCGDIYLEIEDRYIENIELDVGGSRTDRVYGDSMKGLRGIYNISNQNTVPFHVTHAIGIDLLDVQGFQS